MKRPALWIGGVILAPLLALLGYALEGYIDARGDAAALASRAQALLARQRGPADLGPGRIDQLLAVEDPGFRSHAGTDFSSPGGGLTTLTQSLAKRIGFTHFSPGIRKIRLVGYAVGLEAELSKTEILALYLDEVAMGRGPQGWMKGFFNASESVYGRHPADLSEPQFLTLVAVPIAPSKFDLVNPDAALRERVRRIERLVARQCRPAGLRDVWLEGCANSDK